MDDGDENATRAFLPSVVVVGGSSVVMGGSSVAIGGHLWCWVVLCGTGWPWVVVCTSATNRSLLEQSSSADDATSMVVDLSDSRGPPVPSCPGLSRPAMLLKAGRSWSKLLVERASRWFGKLDGNRFGWDT